jgi:sec-independent protein translocase protein TatC
MGASLTWYYRETIFRLLFAPAHGSLSPFGGLPIFTSPIEMMGATIHLAVMGGVVTAFPVVVFSGFRLLSPLLSQKRRRLLALFLLATLVSYGGGAAFAYLVMLPASLKFLLHFGDGIAVPVIRITEYMKLVTALIFWFGVIFELPIVMFLLAKVRVVSYERFRRFRKYVPAAAFVLSALITPTFDVVTQTMMAVPIIVLYEVGLLLARMARPRHN